MNNLYRVFSSSPLSLEQYSCVPLWKGTTTVVLLMRSVCVKYLEVGAYWMINSRTEFCVGVFQQTVQELKETLDTPTSLGGGGARDKRGGVACISCNSIH